MKIWVWRDCEPLPIDLNKPRLMRAGMLCAALAARGHEVRWFNSTFNHYQKSFRAQAPGSYRLDDGTLVELVAGLGYLSNGAPRRLLHNALVARRFVRRARELARVETERPDIIVADLPMPDSALAAVRLARDWSIPSVVSVRDLWPDFFASFLSPAKALVARPLIANLDRMVRAACSEAHHLVGISQGYLDWALDKAGREQGLGDCVAPLGYAPEPVAAQGNSRASLEGKGVDLDKKLATFIGSWGRTYDLKILLEAARRLQDENDLQFVIAGKGEQGAQFEAAAAKLRNVVLPGWLNRSEIAFLLENSTIALAPYSQAAPQGLPNKLFEYLAAGLFQVSTLRSEAKTVLEQSGGGMVVPGGDPAAFAAGICRALEVGGDPAAKQAIKNYFAEYFVASKVYNDYVSKLEEFAVGRTGGNRCWSG